MRNGPEEGAAPAAFLATRAVAGLSRVCAALGAATILLILGIVTWAVFQRYVLRSPVLGADEAIGYLLVATIMLGAAEALRRGDHVSIDILTQRAGPRAARWLAVWADLGVIGFALVLGISAWEAVSFARAFGSYSPGYLEMPMWIPQAPMLLGAALLGLVAAARILDRLGARER